MTLNPDVMKHLLGKRITMDIGRLSLVALVAFAVGVVVSVGTAEVRAHAYWSEEAANWAQSYTSDVTKNLLWERHPVAPRPTEKPAVSPIIRAPEPVGASSSGPEEMSVNAASNARHNGRISR